MHEIYKTNKNFLYEDNKIKNKEFLNAETIKNTLIMFKIYLNDYKNISLRTIFPINKFTDKENKCYVIQFNITVKRIKYDKKNHKLFHTSTHKNVKNLKPMVKTLQHYTESRIYFGINLAFNSYGITNNEFLIKNKYKVYELIIPKSMDNIYLYKDPEFETKFEGKRKILKKDIKYIKFLPSAYISTEDTIKCKDIPQRYLYPKDKYIDIYYNYDKLSLDKDNKLLRKVHPFFY